MDDERTRQLEEQIEAVRRSFLEGVPQRIAELDRGWAAFARADEEARRTFHRHAHSLRGAAATLGFDELAEEARVLEVAVAAALAQALTADVAEAITTGIERVRRAVHSSAPAAPESISVTVSERGAVKRVLFLGDAARGEELRRQLEAYAYLVVSADDPAARGPEGSGFGVDALVLDGATHDPARMEGTAPRVVVSDRDDLHARLAAFRGHARGYFTWPLDEAAFVAKLDELTGRIPPDPYRVLVVEDDATLAAHVSLSLERAGIQVVVVSDPRDATAALVDHRPDVVLMDLYMPHCSGFELAGVLRQQDAYVGLPIVFLSSETDLERQLAAMREGGDDFLTKPVAPKRLVASVVHRARRARAMRSFMTRDGLTGLFNHTTMKERLHAELARGARLGSNLAYAMIDIDTFKRLNDGHGHAAGDRILRALSRALQQRLRPADLPGRYGGDELAVILPDCDAKGGLKAIEDVREAFARLRFRFGAGEVGATFSAGVASYPTHGTAESLHEAADRALYEAKRSGRNRVVMAG